MGVVIKQSFWSTVIAYLGVAIGYMNTLYLRPEYFTLDEIGLFTLVTANAMMISPLCTMGMGGSYLKYFPSFRESPALRNQFFSYQFVVVILANVVILFIGYLFRDQIIVFFSKRSSEYVHYLSITAIIVIVNSVFDHLYGYSRAILKVIVPSFLRDVQLRLGSIVLVVGYAGGFFDFEWAIKGLAINYLLALVILFIHLMVSQGLKFDFRFSLIDREWKRKLFRFSLYVMLLAMSFAVINNASYTQVSSMLGAAANGIFTTCFFIGVIVEMPRRNMGKVISPILSEAFDQGDRALTERIYKKSSITMSAFGVLLFIGIMTNLGDLFAFIPKGDQIAEGYGVVLAVCLAKLTVMVFSFSGEIINYSAFYRYNLLFQVLTAVLLIALNVVLIPIWGLNGVALSYFTAVFLHALMRFVFVKYHFGIHPFLQSHLRLFAVGGLLLVAFFLFDTPWGPLLTIVVRSVLTTLIFVFLIYKLKISEDINKLITSTFERFFP